MNNNHSYYQPLTEVVTGNDQTKITVLKVVYASAAPYYICLWSIKYAILGLYYRIVPKGIKTRWFLHFTLALAIVGGVAIVLLNLFLCEPIYLNWTLDTRIKCYSSTEVLPFVVSVILDVVVDICIFIIPFPILRTMQSISQKQKWGIIGTFSIGVITIIIAVVRVVILAISATISTAAVLTAVECFGSMAVACLPSMRVLLKSDRFRRRNRQSGKSDYSDEAMNDIVSEVSSMNAVPSPEPHSKHLFRSHVRQEPSFVSYDNHTLVGGSEKSPVTMGGVGVPRYNNNHYGEEEEDDGYHLYNSMRQEPEYVTMEHINRHNPDMIRQSQMSPLGHHVVHPMSHDSSVSTLHSQVYQGQAYGQPSCGQPQNYGYPNRYMPDQPLPPLPPRANNDDDDLTMPNYILHEPLPNPVI